MTGAAEAVAAPAQGLVQSPRNVAPIGTASEGIRNMDPECSGAPLLRFARWRSHVALVVAFAVVITARAPAPAKGPGGLPGNGNTGARPWIDARCGGCHQTEDPFTHPVGVVPSMPIPPGLPLEDGRIECTTCHDNRASADHARAREFHAPLLRQEPADLCAACHDPAGTSRRDMHATMLGRAHLRWPDDDSDRGSSRPGRWPARPDSQSGSCLGCHDGAVAGDASDARGLWGFSAGPGPSAGIGASHPVGIEYRRHPGMALKPAASLDRRIRLFDNRVGCGSCHSPFADDEALLVMSNLRSRLCLSCHEL
jgi:predicted CXXCH cytochrome family protein